MHPQLYHLIQIDIYVLSFDNKMVIDVRTPAEYENGHIPGAVNIPVFSNEERAVVGKKYKKVSRIAAATSGLEFVADSIESYFDELEKVSQPGSEILIHCWRGGMRSNAMAKLYETIGYKTSVLIGGYKAYRNFVLDIFNKNYNLVILGGMTGSGKSDILHELTKMGEQVIDLEGMANHKGSAFGALGQKEQPTAMQFENQFHYNLSRMDAKRLIWVEDESRRVGNDVIPLGFFEQMRTTKVFKIEMPKDERVKRLVKEYADFDNASLTLAVTQITKRMGSEIAAKAIKAINEKDFYTAISLVLNYYDKAYAYGLEKREGNKIMSVSVEFDNPVQNAEILLKRAEELKLK